MTVDRVLYRLIKYPYQSRIPCMTDAHPYILEDKNKNSNFKKLITHLYSVTT